jgi:hypothetical protein
MCGMKYRIFMQIASSGEFSHARRAASFSVVLSRSRSFFRYKQITSTLLGKARIKYERRRRRNEKRAKEA